MQEEHIPQAHCILSCLLTSLLPPHSLYHLHDTNINKNASYIHALLSVCAILELESELNREQAVLC